MDCGSFGKMAFQTKCPSLVKSLNCSFRWAVGGGQLEEWCCCCRGGRSFYYYIISTLRVMSTPVDAGSSHRGLGERCKYSFSLQYGMYSFAMACPRWLWLVCIRWLLRCLLSSSSWWLIVQTEDTTRLITVRVLHHCKKDKTNSMS